MRVVISEFVVAQEPEGRFTIHYPLGQAWNKTYKPLYIVRVILKPEFYRRIEQ